MLGKCFGFLCTVSVIFSFINGTQKEVADAIINGASKSISTVIAISGMIILWGGIMNVLKDSGGIGFLSKILRPFLRFIFPRSFKENVATDEITACISANLLGIANGATPLAIKAIEKMSEKSDSELASDDMITLCVLGCSSFSLVPTTVIAIRTAFNATIRYEIIVPVWICSGVCAFIGILLCRLLSYGRRIK